MKFKNIAAYAFNRNVVVERTGKKALPYHSFHRFAPRVIFGSKRLEELLGDVESLAKIPLTLVKK